MGGRGMFDTKIATQAVADATGLVGLGARWTAHAALHSGIFTRLQLRAWLQRPSDDAARAVASRIVTTLTKLELASEDDLPGIGRCVRIHAKEIYQAPRRDRQLEPAPARPGKGARAAPLPGLRPGPSGRGLAADRRRQDPGVRGSRDRQRDLARRVYRSRDGESETTRYFVEKFPLAVDFQSRRAVAACVSPGTTHARLRSWLKTYGPLLQALKPSGVHAGPGARVATSGDGGVGGQEAGEPRHGSSPPGARTRRRWDRIRRAVRAGTKESLEPVGGLSRALETVREIYARRGQAGTSMPSPVTTRAWTSLRIGQPELGF